MMQDEEKKPGVKDGQTLNFEIDAHNNTNLRGSSGILLVKLPLALLQLPRELTQRGGVLPLQDIDLNYKFGC